MLERFTPGAQRAVVLGQEVARAKATAPVGIDHLVLGTLLTGDHDPVIRQVLGPLDCTIEELVAELDAVVPQGSAAPEGTLPFAATTKGVLTQAFQEATARQDRHIGCEHLLLAVVERGGTASAAMFETHGATHSAMRAALGGGGDGPASFQVRTTKGVGRFRRSSKGAS